MNKRVAWALGVLAAAVVLAAIIFGALLIFGGEEAKGQTVRFEPPTAPGPDPFTKPADRPGKTRVALPRVGAGPYGGTGSNLVCDRELLISSLKARPERLRAWARVRGIRPTVRAVTRYIRSLRPVTLRYDTRVTNHSFSNGVATSFQAILQAGTAVLVDRNGDYVARCRCGNPLLPPVYIPEATCLGCPQDYDPPPPCEPETTCFEPYPDPPPVYRPKPPPPPPAPEPEPTPEPQPEPEPQPPPEPEPQPEPEPPPPPPPPTQASENPTCSWQPNVVRRLQRTTLVYGGFTPGASLSLVTINPNGALDSSGSATADSSGGGSVGNQYATEDPQRHPAGTYTTTIKNTSTGATARCTVTVVD